MQPVARTLLISMCSSSSALSPGQEPASKFRLLKVKDMKAINLFFTQRPVSRYFMVTLFLTIAFGREAHSQFRYLHASNCNCTIGTLTNSSSVEWYGSCSNGYCDGYGTVRYYDPNGIYSGSWIGNVVQGVLDGYGTKYYSDGSILYRGRVKANVFIDMAPYMLLTGYIGDFIIDSLLSGGVDRICEVVRGVFDKDGNLLEVRFRVSCRGQIVRENYYTCTLVVSSQSPYIDIVNANDNAQFFIALNFVRYASRLYDWIQNQPRDRQQ